MYRQSPIVVGGWLLLCSVFFRNQLTGSLFALGVSHNLVVVVSVPQYSVSYLVSRVQQVSLWVVVLCPDSAEVEKNLAHIVSHEGSVQCGLDVSYHLRMLPFVSVRTPYHKRNAILIFQKFLILSWGRTHPSL